MNYVLLFRYLRMLQENNLNKEFPPNRSKKNLILLYLACWLFMAIGALIMLGSVVEEVEWDAFAGGTGIFGFGLFFFLIGKYLTSPRKVSYRVGKEGITLTTRKKNLNISYNETESIMLLKEKQAEEFMLRLRQKLEDKNLAIMRGETEAKGMAEKLKAAFGEQTKSFGTYKFLSTPIMYIKSGRKYRNKVTRVNIPCDTVFILLKSGEGYLISPLDTEGFVNEAKKYLIT